MQVNFAELFDGVGVGLSVLEYMHMSGVTNLIRTCELTRDSNILKMNVKNATNKMHHDLEEAFNVPYAKYEALYARIKELNSEEIDEMWEFHEDKDLALLALLEFRLKKFKSYPKLSKKNRNFIRYKKANLGVGYCDAGSVYNKYILDHVLLKWPIEGCEDIYGFFDDDF